MQNPTNEALHAHAWKLLPNITNQHLTRLHTQFHSFQAAWQAPLSAMKAFSRTAPETFAHYQRLRPTIKPQIAFHSLKQYNIHPIYKEDAIYPAQLKPLPDAPWLLYARGNTKLLNTNAPTIAVVGSRKQTSYGREVIRHIIAPLINANITIVSGLALGNDAGAHIETLKHHGQTIAVLGSGSNDTSITPPSNFNLARRILDNHGLILSEYPPHTPGLAHHFPARNRIIAGLSAATIVIEGALKSGALITARLAAEYGREVWAVPGSIFSQTSAGCNHLIEEGAHPFTTTAHILETLDITPDPTALTKIPSLANNPVATKIFQLLQQQPRTPDAIASTLNITPTTIIQTLSELEISGLIHSSGDQIFRATS
ncbi:MAG: DNA protecting protein DprA [Candidatus Kerfeldbacteria bacterium RIFCSPHIGHO2_12_FULL_48_17]|uniref:DNA protecting protein DprA n=1 Tax=Candidatus Kerfeldbacteria bacterium RIFCSPHIGHO2_12_FULL_48_17 TaxID=1798542 RepID=A0A1G2B0J2_9BACT|nr:MAG: DNA protecting protein DprA [Candidatus Kerfeldbacteria bacterium RIFCSPHIGHO2_12_FULL_48_17]